MAGASFPLNVSMSLVPDYLPASAWTGHLPFAFWLMAELRPSLFVELGTHHGLSYFGFCQAVRHGDLDTRCHAVDTWAGDEHAGHYGDDVFFAVKAQNDARYATFSTLMRMRFEEARGYFEDGSIDLLHIDGLHTYDAVRQDFESWLPRMSRRGVVLFHDTMVRERDFGVWRLWSELSRTYPSFEFRHSHGLGVLLVGPEPPESLLRLVGTVGTPAEIAVRRLFEALAERACGGVDTVLRARNAELEGTLHALRGDLDTALGARAEELRRTAEQQARARLDEVRDETALEWSRKVVAAREDTAARLSAEVRQMREALAEEWRRRLEDSAHALDVARAEASAALDAEREKAATSIASMQAEIDARGQALQVCTAETAALAHALEACRAEVAELADARAGADRALARANARIDEIEASSSWKLTAPLRGLRQRFGGRR